MLITSEDSAMGFTGRKTIYTDETKIDASNIVNVLTKALIDHERNRSEIKFLLDYEKGVMPIDERDKQIRPEINVKVKDNMAAEITDFKLGYEWGNPITYVQRAKNCIHKSDSDKDDLSIAALNEMMEEECKAAKDQELARYIEICGVGYRMILPKKNVYGASVFDIIVLNPLNTFVVYSNDIYKKPMMACSYAVKENGSAIYGCYTNDTYYEIENVVDIKKKEKKDNVKEEKKLIGKKTKAIMPQMIPIIEYVNDYDRMGCFEKVISEIDALNIVKSDRVNDVVQCVQSMVWANNIELPDDADSNMHNGMWLVTKSTGNGADPKLVYLSHEMSQNGIQTLTQDFVDRILQKTNVPGRQEQGGGSTGSAMNLSNGWQGAEVSAKRKEPIIVRSEMECLKLIKQIVDTSIDVNPDIKDLELADISIKFSRNKTYDLATKCNSLATLINTGIDGLRAIETVGLFTDPQQVWNDSKELINKKQKPVEEKQGINSFDMDSVTTTLYANGKPKEDGEKLMPDITDQPSKQSMVDEGN